MRILGIDPGFERLGIAIVEKNERGKEHLVHSECFKTSAKMEFPQRLSLVGGKIKEIIKKYKPDVLAIETLFMSTNQKTAMRVAEARGVVVYEAAQKNLKIVEFTPLQIKMATTGYGKADKAQIIRMVKMLIDVGSAKNSDDELDAIAVALTAFATHR